MWETWVWSLGWEGPLEKGKGTHSSIVAWRIPWTIPWVAKSRTGLSDFHFHMNSFSILINPSKLCLKKFCQMLLLYFFLSGYSLQIHILLYLFSIVITFPYYFSQVILDFIFVSFAIPILLYIFFFTIYRKFTFLCCFVLLSFFFYQLIFCLICPHPYGLHWWLRQ